VQRLQRIQDRTPEIADGPHTDPSIQSLEGHIAFRDVWYQYEDEDAPALRGVSFELPADRTLAVVGRTGSGKSTLVRMIPRLLDPDAGTVEIDGHDLRTLPLSTVRENMGYVPQDVFLFSDTVANNIAFGDLDASRDEIRRAAAEADLLDNVRDFPDGFDTYVGERGITLSGGQKQRTSIARALIRNPRVLIFDDALSAVDTATERNILRSLRQRQGSHTLVIVSHRLSAVQEADLILVMEKGAVVQRGTHAELVAQDGLYAELYERQMLEEEIQAM
jgi:ATP-binding cassette subfamily B protein